MPPVRGFLDGENGAFLLRFRPAGAVGWLVCIRPISIRGEPLKKNAFLTYDTLPTTISGAYSVIKENTLCLCWF